MSVLEVRNLKKSFGKDTVVLKGVDFSLEKGETVAIIGSSGSGKTTLLRCLNFLTVPDEGQIVVNDETLFDDADPNTQKEREIRRPRRAALLFYPRAKRNRSRYSTCRKAARFYIKS